MLQGHALVGRQKHQAAFLLPNMFADDLVWRSDICPEFEHVTRTTAVVLGASGVITCYFPHSAKVDYLFSAGLADVDSILTYMRLKHQIKYIVLCCDLNLQIPRDIGGVTGDVIHGEDSPKMEARELALH